MVLTASSSLVEASNFFAVQNMFLEKRCVLQGGILVVNATFLFSSHNLSPAKPFASLLIANFQFPPANMSENGDDHHDFADA